MASLALGVRFNTASSGSGDFITVGAVQGYRNAAGALVDGKTYRYRSESADLSQWEYGFGIWTAGTSTLARSTVSFSSTGSKIGFSAAPQVSIIPFVEDILAFDDAMALTDTQQSQARSNINAAPIEALSANNIIINGAMEVSQFNGTSSVLVTAGIYIIDQFIMAKTGSMVVNAQQVTDAPPGFSNSVKMTVSTAAGSLGSTDSVLIQIRNEGYRVAKLGMGTASASQSTLGFWVKSHRTGLYSGSIQNNAANRSWPFSFTITTSDTWEYKTITVAGDVSGTWLGQSNSGLSINFTIAAGSSNVGTANVWSSSSLIGVTGTTNGVAATTDTFQITGVYLLPGAVSISASHSAFLMRPYDVELQLSRRYFYSLANAATTFPRFLSNGTNSASGNFLHPVQMRTAPTMTVTYEKNDVLQAGAPGIIVASQDLWGFTLSASASDSFDLQTIKADARL